MKKMTLNTEIFTVVHYKIKDELSKTISQVWFTTWFKVENQLRKNNELKVWRNILYQINGELKNV
jgi:hypothetical protein